LPIVAVVYKAGHAVASNTHIACGECPYNHVKHCILEIPYKPQSRGKTVAVFENVNNDNEVLKFHNILKCSFK
jgi:hypothetical protein